MGQLNQRQRADDLGVAHDQVAGHDEGFLVGQGNMLTRLNGFNGWQQTRVTHQGHQNHIQRIHLHN